VSQQAKSGGADYLLLGSDGARRLGTVASRSTGARVRTWPFGLILANTTTIEDTMPAFTRMFAKLEEPAELLSDDFQAVVLFSGIGLLVWLIAVCTGVQGVWL
jgi:hypothetical protein